MMLGYEERMGYVGWENDSWGYIQYISMNHNIRLCWGLGKEYCATYYSWKHIYQRGVLNEYRCKQQQVHIENDISKTILYFLVQSSKEVVHLVSSKRLHNFC